jgi:hypothetical protein
VGAVVSDIDRIVEGGSALRLVVGSFGSGKTFFLALARSIALNKKLVTLHADLSPDRRLQGTNGVARALYSALVASAATRAKPDGGALGAVVERFISTTVAQARQRAVPAETVLREQLASLTELPFGFDFSDVVCAYWRGHEDGDDNARSNAIRWLRGEYATRTDARSALGVRSIVDDANVYAVLKVLARFVRLAGYSGLLVCFDEMVNLYKLSNTTARQSNYEQILMMINDCFQGTAVGCGFLLGGTPEFLMDQRKGLFSYPALQSRLAENPYATKGLVDYSGPILRLASLTPEEMYILLHKLQHVHAYGDPSRYLIPDEGVQAFMAQCAKRVGDAYFRTPRNTIKEFLSLLAVLEQNPQSTWRSLVGEISLQPETSSDLPSDPQGVRSEGRGVAATLHTTFEDDTDELASFRL